MGLMEQIKQRRAWKQGVQTPAAPNNADELQPGNDGVEPGTPDASDNDSGNE